MRIPEDFIHYVWQFKLFDKSALQTTDGCTLQLLNVGLPNKNAGPDFTNAKIVIDDTTWVGQIEIHLKSSDWNTHQHQNDAAYNNVILHVVLEDDEPVYTHENLLMPTLELKNRISPYLFGNYENLMSSTSKFPCENQVTSVDTFVVDSFLSRVLIERFEHKSKEVFDTLALLYGDWDETFYHFMARNFGFKVNGLPMKMLAQSLPQGLFAKHKDQMLQIEALLFGQAGFLEDYFKDEYPNNLKQEYEFLRKKYQLKSLEPSIWKFMRMRPQNFPTLRIAQFAGLIVKSSHLFSKILKVEDIKELKQLFEELPINNYWQNHYHFKKESIQKNIQLGKSAIDNILINTVSLFLFAYSKFSGDEHLQTRAFQLLESVASEKNAIIDMYLGAGVEIKNAYQSQAILQLNKFYCREKQCLKCSIGNKILLRI